MLPEQTLRELKQVIQRVWFREEVYEHWNYRQVVGRGGGLSLLFSGPPGTGKTLTAEVLAMELGWNLYQVDLSQVINKYIGETEKQLKIIFDACRDSNSILFFDEADALFGKRTETRDAHHRYANITTGFLLQQLEEHPGMTILATNSPNSLDKAFTRRFTLAVEFGLPDQDQRRRLWEVLFPPETPLAEEIDFDRLASEISLSGGHYRNIALTAAFLARSAGTPIQLSHVEEAARQELKMLGRIWSGLSCPGEASSG